MYEWMDVWKNLFIYLVCLLIFSRTCLQVCQTFEILRDTPRPLVVAGGLAAGQAGWNPQHKHQTIINNHTSNDIVNIHTTNATGKFKYLQHSATWTPTPLRFASLSASTAHSCSLLPLLLQLLELCPLPPVSGIT